MNSKRIYIAIGAAAAMMPLALLAQADPNQNPQNPTIMNQNSTLPGSQLGPAGANGTSPTNNSSMRETLGAPGQTGQQMADKQFLRTATEGGMAEVKMGMLAAQKGGPEVKDLGQKMVDDHTTINKDMASVADTLGYMLPKKITKDDQAEYDKLNSLSGDAFDKEYIAYTAKAHRQDLHDFRAEASVAADPELATEVTKASGMIRQHLMMVGKLAEEKGVVLPPRPPRPSGAPAGPLPASH